MAFPWSTALVALSILLILFLGASVLLGRLRRRSHVDLLWALAITGQALFFAWTAETWFYRRLLVAGLACLWGLRLAFHLYRRLRREGEDGRYRAMERRVGDRATLFFLGFFLLQGLLAWIFALPFLALIQDPSPEIHTLELAGLGLFAGSFCLLCLADGQLDRFRRDPGNRGKTCDRGLWSWSRHPNYFFESMLWFSLALMASAGDSALLVLAISGLMLVFLTRVSGIPFTEQQALRSRGDEYRAYQARTSAFFPWPPRHVDSDSSR